MEDTVETLFIKNINDPSPLVRAAFGGSIVAFVLYLLLLCFGHVCLTEYGDPSLLYLAIFLFLASLEIYREQPKTVVNALVRRFVRY